MTNAEWMIKTGRKFSDIKCSLGLYRNVQSCCRLSLDGKEIYRSDSSFLLSEFNALKDWLDAEHEEPILDDAERKYLAAVIAPKGIYKNVVGVTKASGEPYDGDFITIMTRRGGDIYFPYYPKGKMYKGMEYGRCYTLEELGL